MIPQEPISRVAGGAAEGVVAGGAESPFAAKLRYPPPNQSPRQHRHRRPMRFYLRSSSPQMRSNYCLNHPNRVRLINRCRQFHLRQLNIALNPVRRKINA